MKSRRRRVIRLQAGKLALLPPYYADVKAVAKLLGVSRVSVSKWLKRGLLRPVRVRGECKVSYKSLATFLARVESGELRMGRGPGQVQARLPRVVNENPPRGVRVRRVSPRALWGFDEHGRPWLIG